MRMIYDLEQKKWFTLSSNGSITLGCNKHPIEQIQSSPFRSISFNLKEQQNEIPLIGILTGRKKDNKVTGNGRLFKELQKEMMKNGGLSIVFTPQNIKDYRVEGFMYFPDKDKWYHVHCPLPHVVYNRVPFRRIEKTSSFHEAHQFFKNRGIPFFNACFLDKYELYQILSKDAFFQRLLPETILIQKKAAFEGFLKRHQQLYLKPSLGSKGKGIYLISLKSDGTINLQGAEDCFSFKDFLTFWMNWSQFFLKNSYIAQKAITPALYNGKRFDFRILVHYFNNQYHVTGVGIRQSKKQNITTHIPNGGILLPYKNIQTEQHDQFISEIAEKAGEILTKEIGFFGEFSIDAGLSESKQYVIYEINSKPMQFDEQDIEKKRYQRLAQLFLRLGKF